MSLLQALWCRETLRRCFLPLPFLQHAGRQLYCLSSLTRDLGSERLSHFFQHHTVIVCWAEIQRASLILSSKPACFQAHSPTLCSC